MPPRGKIRPRRLEHNGFRIATIVSPKDCSTCHAREYREFEASHHSEAARILGSLDNVLAEVVEGNMRRDSPAAVNGCWQCHGAEVKVLVTANTGGISAGASALYLMISSQGASSLYSLNTATGAGTLIGASSPGVCLKNMAEVNGILYSASGYCFVGSKTFTVNPANGASSLLATVSGFDDLLGMAPVVSASAVPEPSTGVMLLLGMVLLRRRWA